MAKSIVSVDQSAARFHYAATFDEPKPPEQLAVAPRETIMGFSSGLTALNAWLNPACHQVDISDVNAGFFAVYSGAKPAPSPEVATAPNSARPKMSMLDQRTAARNAGRARQSAGSNTLPTTQSDDEAAQAQAPVRSSSTAAPELERTASNERSLSMQAVEQIGALGMAQLVALKKQGLASPSVSNLLALRSLATMAH